MKTFIFSDSRNDAEKKRVLRFFSGSLGVHVLLFLILLALGAWIESQPRIVFHSVQAKLVKFGKKREKRLLPRIVKKTQPVVKNKIKDKGNTLKKKKIVKKKLEKPKTKVPEKKKSLENLLAGAMKEIEKDARAEESDEGHKDGAKDGDVTDPTLAAKGNLYARKVSRIIRSNWNIPSLISKEDLQSLQSIVFFRITFSGEVYNISIATKSGNSLFDNSILEALNKTGKLPLPTDKKLKKIILKEGFECPFTAG
ncbi:TonB C-terminal domain-containing protein [bacterium]|nr:TonB C-terminal domain-containing protein [bacterium]